MPKAGYSWIEGNKPVALTLELNAEHVMTSQRGKIS